jgi:hypothetical protein
MLVSRLRWPAPIEGLSSRPGISFDPESAGQIPANMIGRFLDDGDLRKLHRMLIKKKPPAPSVRRRTVTKPANNNDLPNAASRVTGNLLRCICLDRDLCPGPFGFVLVHLDDRLRALSEVFHSLLLLTRSLYILTKYSPSPPLFPNVPPTPRRGLFFISTRRMRWGASRLTRT